MINTVTFVVTSLTMLWSRQRQRQQQQQYHFGIFKCSLLLTIAAVAMTAEETITASVTVTAFVTTTTSKSPFRLRSSSGLHGKHGHKQRSFRSLLTASSSSASSSLGGHNATSASNSTFSTSSSAPPPPPLNQKPPRKVCLMVEPSPFTYVCGYSNRFNEMLRYMSTAGDEFEIVTTDAATPKSQLPLTKFGYNVHHTLGFTLPLYKSMSMTLDVPELMGARVMEKMKPDLIHVSTPGFMVYAAIFYARVMRIPLLMSYHTHLLPYRKNYLPIIPETFVWWLLRWTHSRADLTLCTSPQLQEELKAHGVPRVEVWRKGIDTVRFQPKFKSAEMRSKMTDGNPDDFLMVYVGRLGNEKRLKDIRPMLEKMGPGVRLCIVGNGPQAEELHEYFEGTNTVFTGQMAGDDLSAAFASADAFVMPSDSETLGFVVLESMASGVPVVGAKAGGIPNLIHDEEDGYLVPPGDIDGFVERLTILKDDAETRERFSVAARKEAKRWSWEAATSVLRNVQYEKAIVNFHSRAFNGFGRLGTHYMWRLLKWRIKRVMYKLGLASKPVPPTKTP